MLNREEIIKKYVKNKEVLDIGCVSDKDNYKFAGLHKFLLKYAKNIKGLDINKLGVAYLKKKRYDIIYGNAENFNLNKKFDIIIAGELIEHLNNQGLFLENVGKHLKKDGFFILTTPNSFSLRHFIRNIFNKLSVNKDHTLWHDENTLKNLLRRFNYKLVRLEYCFDDFYTTKSKIERLICLPKKTRPQISIHL